MAIKNKSNKKSTFLFLLSIPILIISTLIGLFLNFFNSKSDEIVADEKKYEYDYEYDDNWEELIAHNEDDDEGCNNACTG